NEDTGNGNDADLNTKIDALFTPLHKANLGDRKHFVFEAAVCTAGLTAWMLFPGALIPIATITFLTAGIESVIHGAEKIREEKKFVHAFDEAQSYTQEILEKRRKSHLP